jgi:hypothetical protein
MPIVRTIPARRVLLRSEHMLDASAYPALAETTGFDGSQDGGLIDATSDSGGGEVVRHGCSQLFGGCLALRLRVWPVAVKRLFTAWERGLGKGTLMPLTMRPSGLASPNRQDFTVYCGDWPMGRIYEESGGPEHMRWFWTLYGVVGKPPRSHTTTRRRSKRPRRSSRPLGGNGSRGRGCRSRAATETTQVGELAGET